MKCTSSQPITASHETAVCQIETTIKRNIRQRHLQNVEDHETPSRHPSTQTLFRTQSNPLACVSSSAAARRWRRHYRRAVIHQSETSNPILLRWRLTQLVGIFFKPSIRYANRSIRNNKFSWPRQFPGSVELLCPTTFVYHCTSIYSR